MRGRRGAKSGRERQNEAERNKERQRERERQRDKDVLQRSLCHWFLGH